MLLLVFWLILQILDRSLWYSEAEPISGTRQVWIAFLRTRAIFNIKIWYEIFNQRIDFYPEWPRTYPERRSSWNRTIFRIEKLFGKFISRNAAWVIVSDIIVDNSVFWGYNVWERFLIVITHTAIRCRHKSHTEKRRIKPDSALFLSDFFFISAIFFLRENFQIKLSPRSDRNSPLWEKNRKLELYHWLKGTELKRLCKLYS